MLGCKLLMGFLFVAAADPTVDPGVDPLVALESREYADLYHHYKDVYENQKKEHHHDRDNNREGWEEDDDHDHIGPNTVRVLNPHQIAFLPHNKHHRRIIQNTYSPDYYQPTWILDYRYQKSGGRHYTRSDGGQIIILPKGIESDEKTKFHNYDELLEFLRLKKLAEAEKHYHHTPSHKSYGHGHRHESYDHKDGRA